MKGFAFLLVVVIVAFSGCDSKGEPVAFGKACGLGNDGKSVEIKGFLADKGSVFCSNTGGRMECGLRFTERSGEKDGFNADIEVGSGANTIDELPRGYKPEDIKVRGDDGNEIDLAKQVTVTGKLSAYQSTESPSGIACFIQVYKIDQK